MSTTDIQEKKRKGVRGLATRKAKRVVVDFPESLYIQAGAGAAELEVNRSDFIRLAVEKLVAELHRKKLEKELAEGYIAMAALSEQVAGEFEHIDSEWQ